MENQKQFNEEQQQIADELKTSSAIEAVSLSKGGKILLDGLVKDIISGVDTLCVKYKSLTLQEFISICADIKTKVDMTRTITRAKKNKDYLSNLLEEKLKE